MLVSDRQNGGLKHGSMRHFKQPDQRFWVGNKVANILVTRPALYVICPRAPDGDIFRPVKYTDTGENTVFSLKTRFFAD